MNKADLGYVAGFVDGEGCIMIAKSSSGHYKNRHHYHLVVEVANTNEWIIHWFQFNFGGYIRCHIRKAEEYGKPIFYWGIQHRQAGEFLKLILPYLKIKRLQAEAALQFQARKRNAGVKGLTDEERALQEVEYLLMRERNKKGNGVKKDGIQDKVDPEPSLVLPAV